MIAMEVGDQQEVDAARSAPPGAPPDDAIRVAAVRPYPASISSDSPAGVTMSVACPPSTSMKKISRPLANPAAAVAVGETAELPPFVDGWAMKTKSASSVQEATRVTIEVDDTAFALRDASSNGGVRACLPVRLAAIIDGLQSTAPFDAARVRDYYDRNTPAFVTLGQGATFGAIHRAVWAPGVADRAAAFRYVEDRLADLIRGQVPFGTPHVVDLGCGVGASLAYLAAILPIRGTGITLSPVQANLAARRLGEAGLAGRVVCLTGNYCDLPSGLAQADLAFAIESFVHAQDPAQLFEQCRRLVRPGGRLVICDDFRRPDAGPGAAEAVERFREGWHVNTLLRADELQALAHARGFEHESTLDLSRYLEIHRARDRFIGALVWLIRGIPSARTRFGHLSGGHALQRCLSRGWVGYDFAVFRRA